MNIEKLKSYANCLQLNALSKVIFFSLETELLFL